MLKKGGTLSVCVPNAELYLNGYANPKDFDRQKMMGTYKEYMNDRKIDIVNFVAYLYGNHKHLFDQEGLIKNLSEQKFSEVKKRSFDPLLDKKERDYESIYAIAIK